MDLPNQKTLPYYVIVLLVSAIVSLASVVGILWKDKIDMEKESKKVQDAKDAECNRRVDACQENARKEAREASALLTAYLMKNDSINRSNERILKRMKR